MMQRIIMALGLMVGMGAGGALALGIAPVSLLAETAATPPAMAGDVPLRVAPYTKTNRYELPVIVPAKDPIRVAPFTRTNKRSCISAETSVQLRPVPAQCL